MNKIKNIYLSYWFKELDYNPSSKVEELSSEVRSIIDKPLMYNNEMPNTNIAIPRIQGISSDNKYFFTMSLINAILSINITEDIDIDEAILLINNNVQLFYDIIKKVYDIKIVYTSIKIEMTNEDKKVKNKLIKLLNRPDNEYENITLREGIMKDDYYINYVLEYSSEYNFDIEHDVKLSEEDLFNKTMVTSLSDAQLSKRYLLTVVEINDRYSYNKNNKHETSKDDIRGMILELKDILKNELYWKK